MGAKINEYPNEITSIGALDYFDSDAWNGSAYQSAKLSGANLKTQVEAWAGAKNYGSFYDNSTQTCASGTIKAMEVNNSDSFNNGVFVGTDIFANPTLFTVADAGVYNIQFSAQLNRTSGGSAQQVSIWLRKNGVDVPNTCTHVNVQANAGKLVAAWNFFIDIGATDSVQIMWSQNGAIDILQEAADLALPHPAVPSVIITINQI
jgi:hypothetical protein